MTRRSLSLGHSTSYPDHTFDLTFPAANTLSVMPAFSYQKLTELQVQGARDRSLRTVQIGQLKSRKDLLENKCRQCLEGTTTTSTSTEVSDGSTQTTLPIFTQAIEDAFARDSGRDLSPFMTLRLANLLDKEYRAKLGERTCLRHEQDRDRFSTWIKGYIEEERQAKQIVEQELTEQLKKLRIEIEECKAKKIVDLKNSLREKKRQLTIMKELKLRSAKRKEKNNPSQGSIGMKDISMKTELIDIDDGYFVSSEESEWVSVEVVCS